MVTFWAPEVDLGILPREGPGVKSRMCPPYPQCVVWIWVELNCLFNVTINDISVIYVTAHRCAGGLKKKYDLRSGSQRQRHFAGFFNVPVLAWVSEIGCLTSHWTIFQLYMWRHIDVQADWRRSWTYGRAPNAIDISQGSFTCPSKHRHGTNLFIRWFRHTAPISRLLRSRWGYGGHILNLNPPGPHGGPS